MVACIPHCHPNSNGSLHSSRTLLGFTEEAVQFTDFEASWAPVIQLALYQAFGENLGAMSQMPDANDRCNAALLETILTSCKAREAHLSGSEVDANEIAANMAVLVAMRHACPVLESPSAHHPIIGDSIRMAFSECHVAAFEDNVSVRYNAKARLPLPLALPNLPPPTPSYSSDLPSALICRQMPM